MLGWNDIEFVFDLADKLFKNVLDGDYARCRAELVDYYRRRVQRIRSLA